MKKLLTFVSVAEAATGLALLVVPALVGRVLLGAELTGVSIPVARVAGIALIALGIACLPGSAFARHAPPTAPTGRWPISLTSASVANGPGRCCGRRSLLHAVLTAPACRRVGLQR